MCDHVRLRESTEQPQRLTTAVPTLSGQRSRFERDVECGKTAQWPRNAFGRVQCRVVQKKSALRMHVKQILVANLTEMTKR